MPRSTQSYVMACPDQPTGSSLGIRAMLKLNYNLEVVRTYKDINIFKIYHLFIFAPQCTK